MDEDPLFAGDPLSSPAGSAPLTAAAAIGAADAVTRMRVRRHPVVLAAILSDFVVRSVEIAAAVNGGRHGDLDRPLIRTMARDLRRDLDRAGKYALARHLNFSVTPGRVLVLILDQGPERNRDLALFSYLDAALNLARTLGQVVDGTLARRLELRIDFSRDDEIELACGLAAGLDSDLDRVLDLNGELFNKTQGRALNAYRPRELILNMERSISRFLDLAFERSRALDRVCAQGVAGRLGICPTEGLAEALLDGAMDDFTGADLTYASLADADLSGVRWSLSGTTWPPGTRVKALLARSEEVEPGGVLVVTRRGMMSPFPDQAPGL